MGEGRIQLGGPQFETAVEVTSSDIELTETEWPRTLTVSRSGNLEAALDVHLAFVGTAEPGVDYEVSGDSEHEVIRTVSFGRGERIATLGLTPIQDALDESERIELGILSQARITAGSDSILGLNLEDAALISIEATVPYALRVELVPAFLQVTRGGARSCGAGEQAAELGFKLNGLN